MAWFWWGFGEQHKGPVAWIKLTFFYFVGSILGSPVIFLLNLGHWWRSENSYVNDRTHCCTDMTLVGVGGRQTGVTVTPASVKKEMGTLVGWIVSGQMTSGRQRWAQGLVFLALNCDFICCHMCYLKYWGTRGELPVRRWAWTLFEECEVNGKRKLALYQALRFERDRSIHWSYRWLQR